MSSRREPYTRRMLGAVQHVAVRMPFRVIRNAGPVPGSLYFDDRGYLVLITGIRDHGERISFTWRRVFTDGNTSRASYHGHWLERENIVKEWK
jgi:hypothetical protein